MSCNGCRVLRKGCSDSCILRPCLQWIETPEAQGHATVFVAKFFGRASLMSFISAVPENQRPALFQSLLYEACGRTVNPVNGAAGLLWTGNWSVCQAAVEKVLHGGALGPIPELHAGVPLAEIACSDPWTNPRDPNPDPRCNYHGPPVAGSVPASKHHRRVGSPSMNSGESGTTTCVENGIGGDCNHGHGGVEPKLLNLFT